jgi:hypothetical protein
LYVGILLFIFGGFLASFPPNRIYLFFQKMREPHNQQDAKAHTV